MTEQILSQPASLSDSARFAGKLVVVGGGTTGIGAATAALFERQGAGKGLFIEVIKRGA